MIFKIYSIFFIRTRSSFLLKI